MSTGKDGSKDTNIQVQTIGVSGLSESILGRSKMNLNKNIKEKKDILTITNRGHLAKNKV